MRFKSETKVKQIDLTLAKSTYFFKYYKWDPIAYPIIDNFWTMNIVVEFEVPEYELITAIGTSWFRYYFWDISVDFAKYGSINEKFYPLIGIPLPPDSVTEEQKIMAFLIYKNMDKKRYFSS